MSGGARTGRPPAGRPTGRSPSPRRAALPDAVRGHWVDRAAPVAWQPYLRLARIERPIGWWLLLLPCWWSQGLAAMAGHSLPNPWHAVLFLVGAVAMRGAGSTYNDIVDRDLDGEVERTRGRPLPSGQVSVRGALAFLAAQGLVGLLVLLQFNPFAVATGFASLAVVALYPFMKRVFWLPQIVLGLAFAWGGLMGWAADRGALTLAPVLLYLGAVAWVVGYDTIYALQDLEDDAVAGIKSSARFFGRRVRAGIAVCYGVAVWLVASAFALADAGAFALAGLVGFAAHLAWQVVRVDREDGALALRLFRSNRDAGLILTAGLLAEAVARAV